MLDDISMADLDDGRDPNTRNGTDKEFWSVDFSTFLKSLSQFIEVTTTIEENKELSQMQKYELFDAANTMERDEFQDFVFELIGDVELSENALD